MNDIYKSFINICLDMFREYIQQQSSQLCLFYKKRIISTKVQLATNFIATINQQPDNNNLTIKDKLCLLEVSITQERLKVSEMSSVKLGGYNKLLLAFLNTINDFRKSVINDRIAYYEQVTCLSNKVVLPAMMEVYCELVMCWLTLQLHINKNKHINNNYLRDNFCQPLEKLILYALNYIQELNYPYINNELHSSNASFPDEILSHLQKHLEVVISDISVKYPLEQNASIFQRLLRAKDISSINTKLPKPRNI